MQSTNQLHVQRIAATFPHKEENGVERAHEASSKAQIIFYDIVKVSSIKGI